MLEHAKDRSLLLFLRQASLQCMKHSLTAYLNDRNTEFIDLAKWFGNKSKNYKEEIELLK